MTSSSPVGSERDASKHEVFLNLLERTSVSRSNGIPLYLQTAQVIKRSLQALPADSDGLLPPEKELYTAIGVSRPTLRQALAHLTKQGLIYTRQGVGTFRAPPALSRPARIASLYADLEARGMRPTTRVLAIDRVPANDDAASELHVQSGTVLERFERLRLAGGRPIALMFGLVCLHGGEPLAKEPLESESLYGLLQSNYGIELTMGTQRISCRLATRREEDLLEVPRKSPVLVVRRVTFDARGRGIEIGTTIYPGVGWEVEVGLAT